MSRFKQPEKKFWRRVKYATLQQRRSTFKQERAEKLGLRICEVCGKTEEDGVYICDWCNRCDDKSCNAGCIECRTEIFELNIYAKSQSCGCCGQIIH